jgi:hypothetical protein
VAGLVEDEQITSLLERMHEEAAQTEERCEQLAGEIDGKKTAILIMAEAGELGHVEIVGAMNEVTGEPKVQELFEWAQPIQQRHFEDTRQAALQLAKQEV